MPRISIGDCSLYYERHGMGFPVVFISGLGGFGSFWKDQVAAFGKRFEVITFDHRGHRAKRREPDWLHGRTNGDRRGPTVGPARDQA